MYVNAATLKLPRACLGYFATHCLNSPLLDRLHQWRPRGFSCLVASSSASWLTAVMVRVATKHAKAIINQGLRS